MNISTCFEPARRCLIICGTVLLACAMPAMAAECPPNPDTSVARAALTQHLRVAADGATARVLMNQL